MATVVMTSPVNGGTYGTQADGSLVPFTAVGFTDIGGQIVYIYDDATNVQLGVTNASSSPQVGGAYSGWYAWSIYIPSWLVASGVALPYAAATAIAAGITRTAVGSLPFAAATTAAGGIAYGVALPVPYSVATTSAGGVSLSGIAAAPFAAATTSAGDISIASDTTAPVVSSFTVGTPSGTNVPVTAFTGTDNVAVTGYLITESSTPPAAGSVTHNDYTAAGYTAVGTGSVTLYPWVRDAAGNVSAVFGSPRTVTIAGGATAVSDNFNRADGALGANWTQIPGTDTYWIVSSNSATPNGPMVGSDAGSYWSANAFSTRHYCETALSAKCAVRCQSASRGCYYVADGSVDEGDSYMTVYYQLVKVVAGTRTNIGSPWYYDSGGAGEAYPGVFRLEADSTAQTVVLKTAPTHGGTYTTRCTASSETSLSGGAPGLYAFDPSMSADNWYGGDLP